LRRRDCCAVGMPASRCTQPGSSSCVQRMDAGFRRNDCWTGCLSTDAGSQMACDVRGPGCLATTCSSLPYSCTVHTCCKSPLCSTLRFRCFYSLRRYLDGPLSLLLPRVSPASTVPLVMPRSCEC
jgi:hypothetical protein